jgi:hypothetical protein
MNTRKNRLRMVIVFLALFARFAYVRHSPVFAGDSQDYVTISENLREHGSFSIRYPTPTIRRPPLYPALLAAIHASPVAACAIQSLADSVTAVLIFDMASMVAAWPIALAASLLYVFNPNALLYSSLVMSETIFTFLCVVAIRLLWHRSFFGAGLVFGAAALCRPSALFLMVAAVFAGWVSIHRTSLRNAAVVAAGCAVIVAPWIARCWHVTGRPVLIQTGGAIMLYGATRLDWNQNDEGVWTSTATRDPRYSKFVNSAEPKTMVAAEKEVMRAAIANIHNAPRGYLRSRLKTVPHLVLTSFGEAVRPISMSYREAFDRRKWVVIVLKILLLMSFSAIPLGLSLMGASRTPLCSAVWLTTFVMQAPIWVEPRYWLPATPLMLVSAAAGAVVALQRLSVPRGLPAVQPTAGGVEIGGVP